jgi:hypothetical protein
MKQKNVYLKQTRIIVSPFLFSLFLLFFFTNSITKSQGLTNKCFKNIFGSHALIMQHDTDTGIFKGFYGSDTGSVGVYRILGKTPITPSLYTFFPITFTIGWGTLISKPNDPSQYWSSSMTGIYYPNERKLNLLNAISAPGPFDDVRIFNPGNLPQSQSFTTVSIKECDFMKDVKPPVKPTGRGSLKDQQYENLLKGEWKVDSQNSYGSISKLNITNLVPRGNSYQELRYYEVLGSFNLSSGESIPFTGIASPYLPQKGNETDFPFAMSLVGTLEKTKDQTTYNISLSGFSSGDGSHRINMFLTKSNEEQSIYRIEANEISTGEIFIKTIK